MRWKKKWELEEKKLKVEVEIKKEEEALQEEAKRRMKEGKKKETNGGGGKISESCRRKY